MHTVLHSHKCDESIHCNQIHPPSPWILFKTTNECWFLWTFYRVNLFTGNHVYLDISKVQYMYFLTLVTLVSHITGTCRGGYNLLFRLHVLYLKSADQLDMQFYSKHVLWSGIVLCLHYELSWQPAVLYIHVWGLRTISWFIQYNISKYFLKS